MIYVNGHFIFSLVTAFYIYPWMRGNWEIQWWNLGIDSQSGNKIDVTSFLIGSVAWFGFWISFCNVFLGLLLTYADCFVHMLILYTFLFPFFSSLYPLTWITLNVINLFEVFSYPWCSYSRISSDPYFPFKFHYIIFFGFLLYL